MDNLAKAAYEYEKWYRLFQIETQESISLVNPQVLQNYWISISSDKAVDSKITKQKKRKNYEKNYYNSICLYRVSNLWSNNN